VLPQLRAASPESTPAPTFIAFPSDTAPATANFPQAAPAPQSTPVNTSSSSNAFVYGQRPPAVPSAGPNDPPRVLYVLATPQVVKQGTTISIQAVTTPNVTRVQVQLGAAAIILHQAGAGLWDATVPFSMPNTAQMTQVPALLTASRADGVAATISIPLTVVP
jgi:hypothetical protein